MKQDQFMYDYLERVTKSLNDKHSKFKDEVDKRIEKDINSIRDEMFKVKPSEKTMQPHEDMSIMMYKMLDKMKQYTIKDGKWYYEGKDTGVKATGIDGRHGLDGKPGLNGKDGVDGKDGKNGINGHDGKNGINGKDGLNGLNSREIELSNHNTYISWRYKNDKTWNKLLSINDLIGARGLDGISSYQQWLNLGNTGTLQDFINSLKGTVTTVEISYADYLLLPIKDPFTIYHESVVI